MGGAAKGGKKRKPEHDGKLDQEDTQEVARGARQKQGGKPDQEDTRKVPPPSSQRGDGHATNGKTRGKTAGVGGVHKLSKINENTEGKYSFR